MFVKFILVCLNCRTEEEFLANEKHSSFSCGKCGQKSEIIKKENKSG
jgi:predicted RNA-binding Zn-ribbon protein involved in translation (DUF1610 family)